MTTLCLRALHFLTAPTTSGLTGSIMPTSPHKDKLVFDVVCIGASGILSYTLYPAPRTRRACSAFRYWHEGFLFRFLVKLFDLAVGGKVLCANFENFVGAALCVLDKSVLKV
jgi:hypothetical protein